MLGDSARWRCGQIAPAPLTLEEAIAQGLANSRRLAEIEARAEAADFAIAGRQAAERPLVALQGGYTRTNHVPEFAITLPLRPPQVVYPDIPDNYRTRLDLQWPIYTGGRADALERAARAERGAIGKDLEAARADLRLEITRAFWAVVTGARDRDRAPALARGRDRPRRATSARGSPPDWFRPTTCRPPKRRRRTSGCSRSKPRTQRAIAEADLRRLTGNDAATAAASRRQSAPAPSPTPAPWRT